MDASPSTAGPSHSASPATPTPTSGSSEGPLQVAPSATPPFSHSGSHSAAPSTRDPAPPAPRIPSVLQPPPGPSEHHDPCPTAAAYTMSRSPASSVGYAGHHYGHAGAHSGGQSPAPSTASAQAASAAAAAAAAASAAASAAAGPLPPPPPSSSKTSTWNLHTGLDDDPEAAAAAAAAATPSTNARPAKKLKRAANGTPSSSATADAKAGGWRKALEDEVENEDDFPLVRCGWNDCNQAFWILEDLLEHLIGEDGHVPPLPSAPRGQKCPCQWAGCPKRGKSQGSRMALIVHLRSHTGEKPFPCHKSDCDKSFSRTDALAKHVRVAHGEVLPPSRKPPTKKGSKAQAGGDEEDAEGEDEGGAPEPSPAPAPAPAAPASALVKAESAGGAGDAAREDPAPDPAEAQMLAELRNRFPKTDPDFLEYIVAQAKHQFVLGEKEHLSGDLKALQDVESAIQRECDNALDELMLKRGGAPAREFTRAAIDAIPRPTLEA